MHGMMSIKCIELMELFLQFSHVTKWRGKEEIQIPAAGGVEI
jgi:hypothetical protein